VKGGQIKKMEWNKILVSIDTPKFELKASGLIKPRCDTLHKEGE